MDCIAWILGLQLQEEKFEGFSYVVRTINFINFTRVLRVAVSVFVCIQFFLNISWPNDLKRFQ